MNSALLLSNAIAIAVLVAFHFQPDGSADQSTQYRTHYVQQAPQLAVMSSASENPDMAQVANAPEAVVLPANPRPDSWVF
ncbi:hypothetical protein IF690_21960 [Pseudomonas sp. SK3(2021)]|uniref:hypothetical protein n=1 Tax=Pseudomonas sp. SK3(2021) TaxID=2841064 RepID=UPI00192C9501|nr:hypothetical protein [Pseudomonas sp. SK3(2021)]QQZ40656.1 hypothetical protein IF690_21960 [Pseudomonas sp. SK3(2021)]